MSGAAFGDPTGTPPPDPAAAVAELWDRVRQLVPESDADEGWARPTPCEDWDVHALVAHLAGAQTAFDGTAPQPEPPPGWEPPADADPVDVGTAAGVAARRAWSPAELLAELETARDGHVARVEAITDWTSRCRGPLGETTEAELLAIRCYDLWVHLQDLRVAFELGVEAGDGSPGARIAYGFVHARIPWLYAKRVDAPPGTALRIALRAPLGTDGVVHRGADGRARWAGPDTDAGESAVDADPAALTLLVSGRGDAPGWQADGLLRWSGPQGAAFVERARFF